MSFISFKKSGGEKRRGKRVEKGVIGNGREKELTETNCVVVYMLLTKTTKWG